MEFIFDYMENHTLRHKLNTLTQKIYGFDFENWMAGGYFEGDYIPYSFMQDGKILGKCFSKQNALYSRRSPQVLHTVGNRYD